MPLFAIICRDRPGQLQTRLDTRPAHLDHIRDSGIVQLAGPLLDGAGQMCGSLVVVEAADIAQARAWAEADPYRAADLFAETEIIEWKRAYG